MTDWSSATLDEEGHYTQQSDIRQLGVLMARVQQESGLEIAAAGEDLKNLLLGKSISAAEILHHGYLLDTREEDASQPT